MITADHGNAEKMLDENGKPYTAHTTNPVPLILTSNKYELKEFSHFLNLKSRNLKPEYEYWRIVIPILFTIISEKVFDALINIGIIKISSILQFIVQLVIIIGVGTISARVIALISKNIWDVSDKSNFYYDYKKIINNMIEAFDEENYHKKG